jgi:hypothetical protein
MSLDDVRLASIRHELKEIATIERCLREKQIILIDRINKLFDSIEKELTGDTKNAN